MMISLPSKWIKFNNLKKGSEIDLEEQENNIIISNSTLPEKSETNIILTESTESSIRNLIGNAYRTGYNKIKVNFENESQFKILKEIIKTRLLGFDIIKKETGYCIVENISEPSTDQFDNILRKFFANISELIEITKKRLDNSKEDYDYKELEETIQKYDNFCRRVIINKRIKNSELLWTFLTLILHGQRELFLLNENLNNIKVSNETKLLLNDLTKLFEIIKKGYQEKNIEILSKTPNLMHEVYKKSYKLLENKKGKENIIIYHLTVSLRIFYQSYSPLSGLII